MSRQELLSEITGINIRILRGGDLSSCSIGERMSWASERVTTRVEDIAYCLMGLFDVHIPMLYGEGNRAFIRLQEEIMKGTEDYTLFAWTEWGYVGDKGLLADSPALFEELSRKFLGEAGLTHDIRNYHLLSLLRHIDLSPLPPQTCSLIILAMPDQYHVVDNHQPIYSSLAATTMPS
jgi:hypothetical protein